MILKNYTLGMSISSLQGVVNTPPPLGRRVTKKGSGRLGLKRFPKWRQHFVKNWKPFFVKKFVQISPACDPNT